MIMIRAIVRQEKINAVMSALMEAGYPGMTRFSVFGRGKQRGVKIGDVTYDELPKEMLMMVIPSEDETTVCDIIQNTARTGESGKHGDGKIFVTEVSSVYTVSTGEKEFSSEPATA